MGSGNLVLYGTATSTITGPVELASSFRTAGNVYPAADVTYFLGSSAARWANIYAATTTIGGTIVIDTDDVRAAGLLTISATDMRLSASAGDQISNSYQEKGHGLFTYFLLKGLKEKGSDMKGVFEYLKPEVARTARRELNSDQEPQWRAGK